MTFAEYLQNQPLLRVAVALIVGIAVGDVVLAGVVWWLGLAAVLLLLILLLRNHNPYLLSSAIVAAIICIGAALSTLADKRVEYPFHGEEPLRYEAVVADVPKVRGKTLQCELLITAIEGKAMSKPVKIKAAILRDTVSNDWRQLHCGSGIEAFSVMQPLSCYYPGSNFDYVRWLHVHGFVAQTFVYYSDWRAAKISLKPLSRFEMLRLKALRLRERFASALSSSGDDQQTAVVAAMVLGDKHAISKETKDVYSISGGSHVLALSGLHLGIIYAILTLLFGRWRRSTISQLLVLTAIWTYVVIVGMGASVMRSAVMLTIYSLCLVARRDKASVNAMSFAAICMLVANPLSLWDVGFQMSFMAVLTIVIYYKPIYSVLPLKNRLLRTLWGMAAVSLAAQIGTAPLVAYYFGRFSCFFLITNFIVIPAATIIIYGAVAMLISMPTPVISSAISRILNFVAGLLNSSLSWIASLPGASIDDIHINAIQVILVYILIMCISVLACYYGKAKNLSKLDAFLQKKKTT